MKSVLIGIVAALAVAFAAHAAYNNFAAGNKTQVPATQSAQPAPAAAAEPEQISDDAATASANEAVEPVALQQANQATLAAATTRATTARPAARQAAATPATTNVVKVEAATPAPVATQQLAAATVPAAKAPATTQKQAPAVQKTALNQQAKATEDDFSNPNSVAEYEFAFVAPEALDNISAAAEQAVQNAYEETVLSPSAPR